MPIAYQFDPQLVLVAAGFDSARGDPIGGIQTFLFNENMNLKIFKQYIFEIRMRCHARRIRPDDPTVELFSSGESGTLPRRGLQS